MPANTILFIVPNRLYIYNECRCCIVPFIHSLNQLMCVLCCTVCVFALLFAHGVAHEKRKFLYPLPLGDTQRLDLCHTQCNMHQFVVVTTDANMYNSGNGVLRAIDGCEVNFPDDLFSVFSPLAMAMPTKKSLEKHRNDIHHYYKAIFSPFMHTHTRATQTQNHTRTQTHRARKA